MASEVEFKAPPPVLPTDEGLASVSEASECKISPSAEIEVPYCVPAWSGVSTDEHYGFEVLKNGCIISKLSLMNASHLIFGRANNVDVHLEHPTISRHHAACQYRALGEPYDIGWYIFDIGSTHGTFVNKEKIPPYMYVRLKVGYVIRFGNSSRLYIMQGPESDEEPESSLSVSEIKERANKQKEIMSRTKSDTPAETPSAPASKAPETLPDRGIDWGLLSYGEDEENNDDDQESVHSDDGEEISFEQLEQREQYYVNDPRKALRKFFEREGHELQYTFAEVGSFRRQWTCRVELPIESKDGKPTFAEGVASVGKKEAMTQCALNACRLLDAQGILRKSAQESKRTRMKDLEANDYYDSDEDTFYDRTGELERKRQKRIQMSTNPGGKTVDNYDTLQEKLAELKREVERTEAQLSLLCAETHSADTSEKQAPTGRDSLDDYMMRMERCDKQDSRVKQSRLRVRLSELKKLQRRTELLIKVARPAPMPFLKKPPPAVNVKSVGPMGGYGLRARAVVPVVPPAPEIQTIEPFTEEFEDENDNQVPTSTLDSSAETVNANSPPAEEKAANSSEPAAPSARFKAKSRDARSVVEKKDGEADYSDWLPPEDQTGDGRTKLNDALGY
ncbi:FHA and dsrm domain containing protein [Trichuris trichiura]|uniref:FHA and dsrm domain containing protein n=1 Tax=Trichuris trichiura TaxID=36087 RepID=A0A077Z0F9_TRITR|nr:FHA and dsrm domain containing protein [Trichuris trichiura]